MKGNFCLWARDAQPPPPPPPPPRLQLRSRLLFLSRGLAACCAHNRLRKPQQTAGARGAPSWSQFWVHLEWLEGVGPRGSLERSVSGAASIDQ